MECVPIPGGPLELTSLKMCDDIQNSVLLTTFHSGRKKYKVYFHRGIIVWDNEKPPYAQRTLPIQNVIAVQYKYVRTSGGDPGEERQPDPNTFVIHYAQRAEKNYWKYCFLTLRHSDPLQVSSWVKTLQNHLQSFKQRPKRLLLFVNPFGGKKKALKLFEKYGKPLFNIAGVDVSVIVSQRPNQIRDIVITHNLDIFDSVACVGGDGTLSELFNGLVIRECRLRGLDPDDITQELPKPSLPVGVIPGGSTDTIAYCLHGTTDVSTAALHIIFGDALGLDLVSVYDENRLLRLYASVLSYGYLGDVAYQSDQYRWMGPKRYDFSGFKKLLSNRGYEGEIAVFADDNCENNSKCYENCQECLVKRDLSQEGNKVQATWKTVNGKFFMISGANITCACSRSPNGIAPFSHLGDGTLHLVLVRHTSLFNNLRLLLRLTSPDRGIEDLSFVETYKAKEFCFRAIDLQSRWNCDGEVQHQTDIRAKVRCQLLTVFSRGSTKPIEKHNGTCCGLCKP